MSLSSPSPPLSELEPRQIKWIAGGYLSMFNSLAGQTLFIALFGAAIRGEFGMSDGQYGLVYTAATLCSAMILVWAGTLADKLPAAILGAGASAGVVLMCLLMSFSANVVMLGVALFGLRLFGQGMLTHNAATALSRWFNRFRGRALAIAQLGFSTGEAILPVLVALGIAAIGWRNVWLATAAFIALLLVPAIAYLFSNPPDGKKAKAAGLTNPDAGSTIATGREWTRARVVADPLFWALLAGILAMPAISTAIFFHQTNLVGAKGWDLLTFAAFFPVMSVTSVASSVAAGWLTDRVGAVRLLPFLLVPAAVMGIVIWLFSGFWVIPVFFLLTGMTHGANGTIVNALWAEAYGTAHLGSIRALATSGMVLASALGPGIVGVFIDLGVDVPAQGPAFAVYFLAVVVLYTLIQPRLQARAQSITTAAS